MTLAATMGQDVLDIERLRATDRIDLDDPVLRDELDRIAAGVATRTRLPASAVTIVLDTAQLFAGSAGLPGWLAQAGGTPIEWSMCANVVTSGCPYLVEDARNDPRQATNPLVLNDIVASYAGVPITAEGHAVGAACLISNQPHIFTHDELNELCDAARAIETVLQRHSGLPA
jgi:GAF domain-containing protein